jgi:toxin YoeB
MPSACWPRCTALSAKKASQNRWRNSAGSWALAPTGEREAVFQLEFRQDLRYWAETDRKTALRVLELVEAVLRDPFTGVGKPEPLKFALAGCWSRRVTQEHRLVYRVSRDRIDFLQARYHY